jgi:hypothetical protein
MSALTAAGSRCAAGPWPGPPPSRISIRLPFGTCTAVTLACSSALPSGVRTSTWLRRPFPPPSSANGGTCERSTTIVASMSESASITTSMPGPPR